MNGIGLNGGFIKLDNDVGIEPDIIYLYNGLEDIGDFALVDDQKEGTIIMDGINYNYRYYTKTNVNDNGEWFKKLVLSDGLYYDELHKIKSDIEKKNTSICDIDNFEFEITQVKIKSSHGYKYYKPSIQFINKICKEDINEVPDLKRVNKGAYGHVYEFKSNECTFVVKVGHFLTNKKKNIVDGIEKDIEIIEYIKNYKGSSKCPNYYIKSKVIESKFTQPDTKKNIKYIIMPKVNGNIFELYNKLDNQNIYYMIKTIIAELYCFYKMDLYYFDLKSLNILYYIEDESIKIVLGDLGSIVKKEDYDIDHKAV